MLKVRGKQEDVNRFLQVVEEHQKQNNLEMVEFDNLSADQDKENGISDLLTDYNFTFEYAQELSDIFPELKLYGIMSDSSNHRTIDYWSKPGSSHMNTIINDIYSPTMYFENWENWWNKDKLYYVEEKEDGSLAIVGYYRWDEELYIPETINDKLVTELADKLFLMDPAVKDIYVGDNIQTIGTSTFSSCKKLLLHTDNKVIIDTLKNTRVMIVTSDDTDESISLKRDFVYKASGKGITIYGYRGDSEVVVIPEKINNTPVNKLANKAFTNCKIKMLTIPASMNKFVPEVFEKAEINYLTAPGVDIGTVKSPAWKQALTKGFIMGYQDGLYTDKKIIDGYLGYLKRNIETFIEPFIDDAELLGRGLKLIKPTPKNYDAMLQKANNKNSVEAKAILLDYKNNSFTQ